MKFYCETNFGDKGTFEENDIVKAIYTAWNVEADLYLVTDGNYQTIFVPLESNKFNSDLLEIYGYKMINVDNERRIVEIKTNKIITYDWDEIVDLK